MLGWCQVCLCVRVVGRHLFNSEPAFTSWHLFVLASFRVCVCVFLRLQAMCTRAAERFTASRHTQTHHGRLSERFHRPPLQHRVVRQPWSSFYVQDHPRARVCEADRVARRCGRGLHLKGQPGRAAARTRRHTRTAADLGRASARAPVNLGVPDDPVGGAA